MLYSSNTHDASLPLAFALATALEAGCYQLVSEYQSPDRLVATRAAGTGADCYSLAVALGVYVLNNGAALDLRAILMSWQASDLLHERGVERALRAAACASTVRRDVERNARERGVKL